MPFCSSLIPGQNSFREALWSILKVLFGTWLSRIVVLDFDLVIFVSGRKGAFSSSYFPLSLGPLGCTQGLLLLALDMMTWIEPGFAVCHKPLHYLFSCLEVVVCVCGDGG